MPAPTAQDYLPLARAKIGSSGFGMKRSPSEQESDARQLARWFAAHDRDALARGGKTIIGFEREACGLIHCGEDRRAA